VGKRGDGAAQTGLQTIEIRGIEGEEGKSPGEKKRKEMMSKKYDD
jgi:hypothetical protein